MQLIYRGTTYNYDLSSAAARRPVPSTLKFPNQLIYRGSSYRINPTAMAETPVEPVEYKLIYRGTLYQPHHHKQSNQTAIANL